MACLVCGFFNRWWCGFLFRCLHAWGVRGCAGFGSTSGYICLSGGLSRGFGRFDLPGAAAMSLLVAPMVAAFYIYFKSPHFADKGINAVIFNHFSAVLSNSQPLSVCMMFHLSRQTKRFISLPNFSWEIWRSGHGMLWMDSLLISGRLWQSFSLPVANLLATLVSALVGFVWQNILSGKNSSTSCINHYSYSPTGISGAYFWVV